MAGGAISAENGALIQQVMSQMKGMKDGDPTAGGT